MKSIIRSYDQHDEVKLKALFIYLWLSFLECETFCSTTFQSKITDNWRATMKFVLLLATFTLPAMILADSKGCIYNERRGLINCRNGGLHNIPHDYFKDKNFHTLDLGVNSITSLSNLVESMDLQFRDGIQTILLDHNKISHLPHHLFETFPNLRYLDLSYNYLERIPRRFCHMTSLTDLILDGNSIHSFSRNAFSCIRNLKYLSLANCNLSRAPNFAKLPNVTINLAENEIKNYVPPPSYAQPNSEPPKTTKHSSNKNDESLKEEEVKQIGNGTAVFASADLFIVVAFALSSIVISIIYNT